MKFLKCSCDHCGGHIEFPADGIGATIPCPHCAQPTELALEIPVEKIQRPSQGLKWFIAGAVILVLGGIATVAILLKAQHLMKQARQKDEALRQSVRPAARGTGPAKKPGQTPPGTILNRFSCSAVTVGQAAGSALVYATGTLRNETDRQRFGVKIELEVFDSAGTKIGTAKDSAQIIEARGAWTFRALLVQKSAASARVASVQEQE